MKDHSILSKAFSRSILRIILDLFPFIFEKWLIYSCTIIALSKALLLERKLAWVLPIISVKKVFSLLVMILLMILCWVLQRTMGLMFLRELAFLYFGMSQR